MVFIVLYDYEPAWEFSPPYGDGIGKLSVIEMVEGFSPPYGDGIVVTSSHIDVHEVFAPLRGWYRA